MATYRWRICLRWIASCHTVIMTVAVPGALAAEIIAALRGAVAPFALVHGSRIAASPRAGSDVDVAAWWASDPPQAFEVLLPPDVDLLVLNIAPLELAGRIALHGQSLFDEDPPTRVRWVATIRKIYADEGPRLRRSHLELAEAVRRGRRGQGPPPAPVDLRRSRHPAGGIGGGASATG